MFNNQFAGSTDQEKWQRYVTALEGKGEIAALGVTDYFTVEGYKKLAGLKAEGRLPNIAALLPNIELRILPVTDRGRAINLHLIVNPEIVDELSQLLFERLRFSYDGSEYSMTVESLRRLGQAYHSQPGLTDQSALAIGAEQFKVNPEDLWKALGSKRLHDNVLVGIASGARDGVSGLRESGTLAMREELLRRSHLVFSGNPADREFFLGKGSVTLQQLTEQCGGSKPCVHGCDAHSLERILSPDENRFTWIKAEPTFEGLRQVCFEPEHRVWIGEHKPTTSVNRLISLRTDFEEETVLRTDGIDTPFCARGELTLNFSPGLTCFIGGRGSGKSTLLNLLHAGVSAEAPAFFKEHDLRHDDEPVVPQEHSHIDAIGSIEGIDIIGQNDVERFALDPSRLTAAIVSRLLASSDGDGLRAAMELCSALVKEYVSSRGAIDQLVNLDDRKRAVERDVSGLGKLIESVTDTDYLRITSELQVAEDGRRVIETSRLSVLDLATALRGTADEARLELADQDANEFDVRAREAIARIDEVVEALTATPDPNVQSDQEKQLANVAAQRRAELIAFLEKRGLKEENLAAAAGAVERKAHVEKDLQKLNAEEQRLSTTLPAASEGDGRRRTVEALVDAAVTRVNEVMVRAAPDRPIELYWKYDEAAAEEDFVAALAEELNAFRGQQRTRVDYLLSEISKAGPVLSVAAIDLYNSVRSSEAKHAQQLDAFLGSPRRQLQLTLMQSAFRSDVARYLRIGVVYDGRDLRLASFGQRCAAVLFVLLAIGSAPLVIDEPEAHLDSALIADRLVPLLKARKAQRQVIFATHNANFVVNGDAELIHFVHMGPGGKSEVTSFTIEDLAHRETLLRLEGGADAFHLREAKYFV